MEQNNSKASCLCFKSHLFRCVLLERTDSCSPVKSFILDDSLNVNSEKRYLGNLCITVLHQLFCEPINITVLYFSGKFWLLARARSIIFLFIFTHCYSPFKILGNCRTDGLFFFRTTQKLNAFWDSSPKQAKKYYYCTSTYRNNSGQYSRNRLDREKTSLEF